MLFLKKYSRDNVGGEANMLVGKLGGATIKDWLPSVTTFGFLETILKHNYFFFLTVCNKYNKFIFNVLYTVINIISNIINYIFG